MRKLPNKAQIPPNPKIDARVPQIRNNVEDVEREELVPMGADKPYGLEVENFLPVSDILEKIWNCFLFLSYKINSKIINQLMFFSKFFLKREHIGIYISFNIYLYSDPLKYFLKDNYNHSLLSVFAF